MSGRDEKGRFIKGAKPGPGRPALAAELPIVEGLRAAVTAEQVAIVLEKLFALGLKGNTRALEVYLAYALGKPKQFIDLTNNGGEFVGPIVYLPEPKEEV